MAHYSISLILCLPGNLAVLWDRYIPPSPQTSQSLKWPLILPSQSSPPLLKLSLSVSSLMWMYIRFCSPRCMYIPMHIYFNLVTLFPLQHVCPSTHTRWLVFTLCISVFLFFFSVINTAFLMTQIQSPFHKPVINQNPLRPSSKPYGLNSEILLKAEFRILLRLPRRGPESSSPQGWA